MPLIFANGVTKYCDLGPSRGVLFGTIRGNFSIYRDFKQILGALRSEEFAQQLGTLISQYARNDTRYRADSRVLGQIEEGTVGTEVRIRSSVNYARNPRKFYRPGAHSAGLECYIERAIVKSPITQHFSGATNGDNFCVLRCIMGRFDEVVGRGNHFLAFENHSSHRHFAIACSAGRFFECKLHVRIVALRHESGSVAEAAGGAR